MVLFTEEMGLPVYNRFSVIILTLYLYYGMTYYFVLDTPMEKPHIGIFMIVLALHVLQVVLLKYLHENEHYPFIWLAIILPVILFILIKKIMDKKAEKKAAELNAVMAAAQTDTVELGFRNAKAQAPTTHTIPISAQKPYHMDKHYDSANMNKSMVQGNRNMGNIVQDINMQYDSNSQMQQRTMNVVDNTPDYSSRMSVNQLAPTGQTGIPMDSGYGMIGGPAIIGGYDPYASDMSSF